MRRRWLRHALVAMGLTALAWGAYRTADAFWLGAELDRAKREVAGGRFGSARARLTRLAGSRPGAAEVHFQLGLCEEAAGDPARAMAAWARVPPASPLAAMAAQSRDRVLRRLFDSGRFAALEETLEAARRGGGAGVPEFGQALVRLLRFEGRFDEVRLLLKEEWARAPDPSRPLRDLWMLDSEPVPAEMVRGVLDQAAGRTPDDDRVWLGRANLATWSGRFEEADRWLSACLERRPLDPAVWRARLNWATAAGRVDVAGRALTRLPAERLDPAEALELRSWFAARRCDHEGERLALELLIEETPGDPRALERLATLASEAGRAASARELRRRKAYVDEAKDLYRKLLAVDATTIDLPTVARLAESLGRWFEARGWWSLVARFAPHDPEAHDALDRLARRADRRAPDRSLDDLITASGRGTASTGLSSAVVPPEFSDDAEPAGLRFTYDSGQTKARQLPETMGGGVGLLDYDRDGWLDVYFVQGGPFPSPGGQTRAGRAVGDRLFRNRGDGTFEDQTRRAGVSGLPGGYGHGVAVGDFDNDGLPDLFVARWRSYALSRNRGDGTFEDVTEGVGLGGDRDWPTSAAFADLDDDGDLDLFVCHYLAWDAGHPALCNGPPEAPGHVYCDPRKFGPLRDHLFRNDGGRFVDVTADAGIVDRGGRGLGVVAADLDGDGRVDLYVANDTTANYLFHNLGGLRFEEMGVACGVATAANGGFQAGMGVACGDLDGDGLPDLAVTNFYGESTTLYHNLGGGVFGDRTADSGLAAATRSYLGFGIAAIDYNNDGRLDLATSNGHVNDYRPTLPYAMPTQLLAGVGGGRLFDASASVGPPWDTPRVGRGLAAGDLDNDGRPDLIVVAQNAPAAYLRNRTEGGHFITLRLEGTASNRDGVGARVTVTCDGRRMVAQRTGGGSYLSASDDRLHFGLGGADRARAVEIRWPSGRVDRHRDLPADAGYLLREGHAEPLPLRGFPRGGRGDDPGAAP